MNSFLEARHDIQKSLFYGIDADGFEIGSLGFTSKFDENEKKSLTEVKSLPLQKWNRIKEWKVKSINKLSWN